MRYSYIELASLFCDTAIDILAFSQGKRPLDELTFVSKFVEWFDQTFPKEATDPCSLDLYPLFLLASVYIRMDKRFYDGNFLQVAQTLRTEIRDLLEAFRNGERQLTSDELTFLQKYMLEISLDFQSASYR